MARVVAHVLIAGLVGLSAASCGGGQPKLQCPAATKGGAEFDVAKSYDRYDVEGSTLAEFEANAQKNVPFHRPITKDRLAIGVTDAKPCTSYEWTSDGTQCSVHDHQVRLVLRITTPRWVMPKHVSEAELAEYRTREAELATHEEGHAIIATAAARYLLLQLKTVTTAPTCDEASERTKAIADAVRKDVDARNADYDVTTDHGLKQTAVDLAALPAKWIVFGEPSE